MRLLAMSAFLAIAAVAARGAAQDRAQARRLFDEGRSLALAERWGEAAESFRRAREIVESPGIVCNLGFALYHTGEASGAIQALERCLELAAADPGFASRQAGSLEEARADLEAMRQRVGRLELIVEPPSARVRVDGELVAGHGPTRILTLTPGRHRMSVSAHGFVTVHERVSVSSGATEHRSMTLDPLPARPATLVVESIHGSRIFLDGQQAGIGRMEERLPAGRRRVRVEAEGHAPFEREVTLAEGERTLVDAFFGTRGDLAAEPGLWIGVGAGVLLVAGAIVLAVLLTQSDPLARYSGSTEHTFYPLVASW